MAEFAIGDKVGRSCIIDANYRNELLLSHDTNITCACKYTVWVIDENDIEHTQRLFEEREAAEKYFCGQICLKDQRVVNEISNLTLRELCDGSSYTVLIRYKPDTLAMDVYVNGELKPNIKQISLTAQDMRPPTTYECEMYMPPPAIV